MKSSKTRGTDPHGTDDRSDRSRRWWGMHWHSPFVFPGSSLLRMTGIVRSGTHVTIAHGRQDGSNFHVEHAETFSGTDAVDRAARQCRRFDAPVCAAVPRGLLLDRHYRVPGRDDAEVEAMLGHLLAGDLPLPVDEYAWTWSRVPGETEPMQLVKVFVARNDHLDTFAEPFTRAGLPVVDLVPASWALARVVDRAGGPGAGADEPVTSSFVVPSEGAACLLVTRGGELLYDAPLPECAPAGWPDGGTVSDPAQAASWKAIEGAYRELFGRPLPPPRTWHPGEDDDGERSRIHLAAAVATVGLERHRALMPPERDGANRRRLLISGLRDVFQIVVVSLLVVLSVFLYQDARDCDHLDALERELAGQAERVATLRREAEAVRDFERGTNEASVLAALRSLRRNVPSPIALDHLDYDDARVVTLRGGAPGTRPVLEMADVLAADPLWDGVRVVQLRSQPDGGRAPVHFVLEGRLRTGRVP